MNPNVSPRQLSLPGFSVKGNECRQVNSQQNKLDSEDRKFHDWYRFVLSFPPHLVRSYIDDFGLEKTHTLLDPFCGTGTTLVESKLQGIKSMGLEVNPFAHFASSVKVDWHIEPDILEERAVDIADSVRHILNSQGLADCSLFTGSIEHIPLKTLAPEAEKLLLKNSISPLPLHKVLILLDCLKQHCHESYYRHSLLALAKALVFSISNLRFGPEVGVGKPKHDFPVVSSWLSEIRKIADDVRTVAHQSYPEATVLRTDARQADHEIAPFSIDAVITSPPYPNEKDYTRTTRLESVILGFFHNQTELRTFKKQFLRSNTRGVYKDDDDDRWVAHYPEIQRIANTIEKRRVELGKTSGFEKQYGNVTRQYFGGMARHFAELRAVLRPGAKLAYVVGDQASYLQVMIRTGELLADIAQSLGYELIRVDLFRTRLATATKEQLREEVVVLQWPGRKNRI